MTKEYYSLGLMSGSSLDGLDICYSKICISDEVYSFEILQAETYPYSSDLICDLELCRSFPEEKLNSLHIQLGSIFGNLCLNFSSKHKIEYLDFISSHGHTVFHYPERGITLQIGSGQTIANITKIKTISNLRQKDIDLGGSGAPIVPIGDLLFFPDDIYCLNLGGIMNISKKWNNSIISYDIGSCNQILNYYASQKGLLYDKDGIIASSGHFHLDLFEALKKLDYYKAVYPKSLDNGFSKTVIELINQFQNLSIEDILHTYNHHIAWLISENTDQTHSILLSGGGTHNAFLIEILKNTYHLNLHIPTVEIIDYKEALIMSLMGVRFFENKYNVLYSVTGAKENSICGELSYPLL